MWQHVQEQGVRHEPPADAHRQEDGAVRPVRVHVLHQTAAGRAPDQARQAVRVRHMQQAVRAKVAAGRARERGALQPAAVRVRVVQQVVQDEGLARRAYDRAHGHTQLPVSALRQEVPEAVRPHVAHTHAHRREAIQVQRVRPRLRANVRHAQTRNAALPAGQAENHVVLARAVLQLGRRIGGPRRTELVIAIRPDITIASVVD